MYDKLENGEIYDDYWIDYLFVYLKEMKCVMYDGVEIIVYCVWGLIDIVSCFFV